MPFTYSITVGIGAGFVVVRAHQGGAAASRAQVHPLMWLVAALFVVYFLIAPLTELVT